MGANSMKKAKTKYGWVISHDGYAFAIYTNEKKAKEAFERLNRNLVCSYSEVCITKRKLNPNRVTGLEWT